MTISKPWKLYNTVKSVFKSRGKDPTPGTINTVPIAKNLTTKRAIQDQVVSSVNKGIKKADVPQSVKDSQKTKQYASEMKRKKSKELKDYSYTADKITENKAKGGRVGLKGGSGFPDLNKDGKTTFADVLIGRGVLPKNKKKMVAKKNKTPMQKAVKKDKKRII